MNDLYQMAIEESGIGIWVWNMDTNTIKLNDNMKHMVGEIATINELKDKIYKDDLNLFESLIKNDNARFDIRIYNNKNEIIYISNIINIKSNLCSSICYDITDERLSKIKLQEEKRQMSEIFDSIPALVYYKDKDNNFVRVNKALANAIGKDKEYIEGKNLSEFYPEEHCVKYHHDDMMVLESQKPNIGLIDIAIQKDGATTWYNTSKIPCFDENNNSIGIIGFSFDITDQYLSDKKIKESEETYRTIVKNATEPIILTDSDGYIILTNNILISILELEYKDVIGKKLSDFVCDQLSCDILKDITNNRTKLVKEEIRLQSKDECCIPFNMSYCPININSHFKGGVYILSDISERIEKENIIRDINTKLKRKNQELESFTSSVSHDLKAPVRQVKMFSDMTINSIKNKKYDSIEKNLIKIKKSCSRMQELIDDLLALSRISTAKKKFDYHKISEIIGDAMDNMENDIVDNNVDIDISSDIQIYSDKTQMIQLFQNLIGNSIKFRRENEDCKINVKYINRSIVYSDNGIGFDNKYKEKIFEMFERLYSSDTYEGNGIGLTICKKIVEEHGWNISADGAIDNGCSFTITIPEERRDNVRAV